VFRNGDDLGEATYAMMIKPGEEIHLGAGQTFRVVAVGPVEEEDDSPLVEPLEGRSGQQLRATVTSR
jgi:hypothetical protein